MARAPLVYCGMAVALLGACREGGLGPEPPRIVQLSPDTLRLALGDTSRFTLTVTYEDGEPVDRAAVDWFSSDPTVATVDSLGNVAVTGLGSIAIIAVSAGYADSGAVVTGLAFTALTAGDAHTCGLVPGGDVYCWGDGRVGQLGNGTTESKTAPVRVASGVPFTAVSAGAGHTCALAGDGTAYCWGASDVGQRGDGTTGSVSFPTPVVTTLAFATVSAGWSHTCGLTTGGVLHCWGANLDGQLGDGTFATRFLPDSADTDERFTTVRAGRDHTCAVNVDGRAHCWGRNADGQLGLGSPSAPVAVPTKLPTTLTFRTVDAAFGTYSCGIWLGRLAYCWGRGDDGQLGTGNAIEPEPVNWVDPDLPFATLDAGASHTCGTTTALETYCWGTSRLGLPGTVQSDVPIEIPIPLTSVVTGTLHTCGISGVPGPAYCWGGNGRGQLGTGSTAPSNVPELVALQLRF